MNVLVVEDNEETRDCLQMLLTLRGCAVKACGSTHEALAALAGGFAPDRVLLDYYLPGADGAAFFRYLRAADGLAGLPVVLMTAADAEKTDEIRREVEDLGPLAVLRKPADPKALIEKLLGGEAACGG